MAEYTDTLKRNGVKRGIQAWRDSGELHIRLKEMCINPETARWETVVDGTVGYTLADDGETVAHDGNHWREYAKARFERLNQKRFQYE